MSPSSVGFTGSQTLVVPAVEKVLAFIVCGLHPEDGGMEAVGEDAPLVRDTDRGGRTSARGGTRERHNAKVPPVLLPSSKAVGFWRVATMQGQGSSLNVASVGTVKGQVD